MKLIERSLTFFKPVRANGNVVADKVQNAVGKVAGTYSKPMVEGGKRFGQEVDEFVRSTPEKIRTPMVKAAGAYSNMMVEGGKQFGQGLDQFIRSAPDKAKLIPQHLGLGNQPDIKFDGHFVGARGQSFPPGIPLKDVPGVMPRKNPNPSGTVIYVNGILNDRNGQIRTLQSLADTTNLKAVGIHNSTRGIVPDLGQSIADKLGRGRNPAVDTLADTVHAELKAGRSVHLMAHSQGAIITSRALRDVARRLRIEDGLSSFEVNKKMAQLKVETFGGAAKSYPSGPVYVHYVNDADPVASNFGLGKNTDQDPGKGAVVHHFREGSKLDLSLESTHSIVDVYLKNRVPFSAAREGRFN
ncbi:hypothetical protein [Corallococcus carmarthensis]|uniref:hypothetical protein n=1 Tax=Corallococcus carmarthensis TaxID=2316728 RepID=UPI0011C40F6B|nr:hypothetical protein [Corallococcus carmarthensis]